VLETLEGCWQQEAANQAGGAVTEAGWVVGVLQALQGAVLGMCLCCGLAARPADPRWMAGVLHALHLQQQASGLHCCWQRIPSSSTGSDARQGCF
jgi:hypothetical protein